jgi:hypothetical protein
MQATVINGQVRHLGLLPTPAATLARMHAAKRMCFSHDARKLLKRAADRNTWVESDCRHFFKNVEDQGSTNMCVGGSGAMALTGVFAKNGFTDVRICPAAVYAPICGGRDQGASMGDCLEALQQYGAWRAGFEDIDLFDWRTAYRTKFWTKPTSAEAVEALRYRITEAVFCSTLEDFLSGLQDGQWTGQFGVGAGNAFEVTGSDGSLDKYDGTRVNHAQTATGGMRKNPKTGVWQIQGLNPWGASWGDGGFYWADADDWLDISGQELWLVRSATLPEPA